MKRFILLFMLMSLLITEAVAQKAAGPPTNVRVTTGDRHYIVSWDPPTYLGFDPPVEHYEYRFSADQAWRRRGALYQTDPHRSVTRNMQLNTQVTDTVRIRAVTADIFNLIFGTEVSHTFTVTPMIPTPTAVTATLDDPTTEDRTVTLTWTAPSGLAAAITGYQYSQDGGAYADTDSGTTASQTITGLKNGISYSFRVKAKRGTEPATPSRTVTVTPLIDAPGTPGTLNVERVGDTAILTWSPPGNPETITRYEYSDDGGLTWQSTGSTDTTYTVTGLKAGQTYTFLVRAVYIDGGTSRIISPPSRSSNAAVLTFPKRVIYECPVGWVRSDTFGGPTQRVLLYEVKLDMDLQNRVSIYKPDWVAIYVHPDEALENLDGWKLHVAVPYNLHREYLLTAENSVVVDANIEGVEGGFAFIKNPEEDPFPMIGMGFTGATVPGFDYRLYDETGRKIDFGIACYKQVGIFQALKDMEDPRVLRNVLLERLDWDTATYIRSEWTVPVPVPAAPSLVKKTIVGTWANLKKR